MGRHFSRMYQCCWCFLIWKVKMHIMRQILQDTLLETSNSCSILFKLGTFMWVSWMLYREFSISLDKICILYSYDFSACLERQERGQHLPHSIWTYYSSSKELYWLHEIVRWIWRIQKVKDMPSLEQFFEEQWICTGCYCCVQFENHLWSSQSFLLLMVSGIA